MPSMPPCPPTTSRLNCSSFLQRLMLLWCYSYGLQCLLPLADVYLRGYFSTLYDNSVIFGGLYACFKWIDSALVCNSINNDTPPSCILYPSGTSFLESFLLSLLYSLSSSSSSRHNYFFIPFQIGTWIPFISTLLLSCWCVLLIVGVILVGVMDALSN